MGELIFNVLLFLAMLVLAINSLSIPIQGTDYLVRYWPLAILIILMSQTMSLIMSLVTGSVPAFEVPVLLAMVCAGAIGGFVSTKLHRKLSAETTDKLFSGLLVVIFLICCYNAIKWM